MGGRRHNLAGCLALTMFLVAGAILAGCVDISPATRVSGRPTTSKVVLADTVVPMKTSPATATVTEVPTAAPTTTFTPEPPAPTDTKAPPYRPAARATSTSTPEPTNTHTATPLPTATPTRTPVPTVAPTFTATRPALPTVPALTPSQGLTPPPGVQSPTVPAPPLATPTPVAPPTSTPTPVPTATPTPVHPFTVESVSWLPNCGLAQIRVFVQDPRGYRVNGLRFRVKAAGYDWYAISNLSGLGAYEPGETDVVLDTKPKKGAWEVAPVDEQGNLLAPPVVVETNEQDCGPSGSGHQVAVVKWIKHR